jgi:hypothetical protein
MRFCVRLFHLSFIAAVFGTPSIISGHGIAPVPAIVLLFQKASDDRLWGLIPILATWMLILALFGIGLAGRRLMKKRCKAPAQR